MSGDRAADVGLVMILRLTVADAAMSTRHDLEVTADPASTVASLLDAFPVDVGGRPVFAGSARLDPATTIGESPIVGGAVLGVGAPGVDFRAPSGGAGGGVVGGVRAVAGPDAGLVAWLRPGRYTVARDPRADVPLRDPDVSRRHALLDVSRAGQVTVTDLGSANGTVVDGTPVTRPTPLGPESVLEVGDDRLEWLPVDGPAQHVTRSPDGHIEFDRAFAPAPSLPRPEVVLPQRDDSTRNMAAVLLSALVPVALSGVMAAVLKQPAMLLFALLGPVSALVTYVMERWQRGARQRAYTEGRAAAQGRIDESVAREERLRHQLVPDLSDLTMVAVGARRGLWPRNADAPDALVLRVGTADRLAAIDLRGDRWPGLEEPVVHEVPVTVDLRATGVLGVVGPASPVDALMRWLLAQLAILRSPDDLRLVLITAVGDDKLAWAGWLPHVDAGAGSDVPGWVGNTRGTRADRITELRQLVTARTAQRSAAGTTRFGEEIVVVLDGALSLRNVPGMREVLRDGPAVGVYAICADRHDMNECRGVCEVDDDGALRLTRSRDDHPRAASAEGAGREAAERIARALSPMRDRLTLASAQTAVPYPVRLVDLFDGDVLDPAGVLDLWTRDPGPRTEVPLGADGSGPVSVDLARQGPHTMLGGATGAGKSVLLQTLVTSLLLMNRPDELNLVLVDFKGGSAFLPFEKCPHVVGLIRSTGETPADVFDAAAATRVLASVRAEVRRRESLLARYGGEIDVYWRARQGRTDLPALPRLVMIFDEFARVLEVTPDFLTELVNVAAKGRSLGMHLVLATQSLQGKLPAELKNNISLRITLRQNEAADSAEVLGVPDAAGIPGRLSGRGMILCTTDETRTPRLFQSGYLGDPPPPGGAQPARVRIVEWATLGLPRPPETADHGDAPTDLDLTIAAVTDAAHRLGLPAPFRPLLPPLPADLRLEDLGRHATGGLPDAGVPFGLTDDPAAQAQPAAVLDLAGTDRLLVAGGPQSGRSTAARTLIAGITQRFDPDRAHVYVIEQRPAGLTTYEGLPHCGAVLTGAEPDRIRRLVTWLDGEVQRRAATRFAPSGEPDPWIVLIVDGWEYFEDRGDPNFVETSLLTTLRGIVSAGTPVGVHVVAIGGQDMMSGKLPGMYSQRLLLPFPKEETRRQHLSQGMVAPAVLPGRAIDAGSGHHAQICRVATDPVPRDPGTSRGLPRPFPAMPTSVGLEELRGQEPSWIPVGVGGPEVTPVGVDLFEAGPHLMLVSGPGGSGRTNAAATVAHGLRRFDIGVLAVCPPRSPLPGTLPDDAGVRVVTGTTIKDADLRDAVEAFGDGRFAVIVDDCEQVTVAPSEEGFSDAPTLLEDIATPDSLGRRALVLCGDAAPVIEGQRRSLMRVVTEIMTAGTRILLTPATSPVARLHGFTLDADQFLAGPPGRGYMAAGRATALVQVALRPGSG